MNDFLILKYIKGQASAEEKRELHNWIDASDSNREHYKQMRKLWDMSILTDKYSQTGNDKAYRRLEPRLHIKKNNKKVLYQQIRKSVIRLGKIAAIITLTFFVSQYIFKIKDTSLAYSSIEVPIGQRTKLTLPDGTQVWLNSGTTLTYPEKFSGKNRTVNLDGEAKFEVTHNKEIPFIVETSSYSVKVLGTEFNVYAYKQSNKFEATLMKGSILLQEDNKNGNELKMTPGQQASFNKLTNQMILLDNVDIESIDTWTNGYLSFNQIPFSEMLDRLSQYYGKKIKLNNPEIADYECTGKFKNDESIEQILKVVKTSKPFRYLIQDNEIIIY